MITSQLHLAERITRIADTVTVTDGGCRAETAGSVYEAANPAAVAKQLGQALYQTTHVGWPKVNESTPRTWRDEGFEALLAKGSANLQVELTGRQLRDDGDQVIIDVDGLRLRVPAEAAHSRAGDNVTLSLPAARPALSPGFYLVTSRSPFRRSGALLRLYAHLGDADDAPGVWEELINFLDGTGLPWQAKISSSRRLYPRQDALTLYLPRQSWKAARRCAAVLENTGRIAEGTSPFAHSIGRGISVAFEPADPGAAGLNRSFGQHRAQVLAEALIHHSAYPNDMSQADRIAAAFIEAHIDPAEPARNLTSPMIEVLPGT